MVHWAFFDSWRVCQRQENGVIFKVMTQTGRAIEKLSYFGTEHEVLLSPNCRFIVSTEPYEENGFTVIDMVEQNGKAFIS